MDGRVRWIEFDGPPDLVASVPGYRGGLAPDPPFDADYYRLDTTVQTDSRCTYVYIDPEETPERPFFIPLEGGDAAVLPPEDE